MKKALAILMVLALVTTVAFAQDAPATFGDNSTVAVSGFGQLAWGVDLNKKDVGGTGHGFENKAEWKISIPLLGKQTFTKTGEGSYAEIKIIDAQYNIEGKHDYSKNEYRDDKFTGGDKKIDKVSAKLVFGNIYMSIYDKPGWKSNQAEIWAPIKNDGYFDGSKSAYIPWDGVVTSGASAQKEGRDLRFEPGFDAFGTKIGYKTDMFEVGVKVGSADDWVRSTTAATDATYGWVDADDDETTEPTWEEIPGKPAVPAVTKSYYAFGIDASVSPSDMITASFTFNNANWDGTKVNVDGDPTSSIMSIGGKVVAKPIADLSVTAGFDAGNDYLDFEGESAFAYDAKLDASYKFATLGFYYASEAAPYTGINADGEPIADAAVYVKLTDGGFVPNLTASVTVIAHHLLSDMGILQDMFDDGIGGVDKPAAPLAIGLNVAYKHSLNDVNYVKPFLNYYAQNMSGLAKNGSVFVSAVEVGADYGLFTNAVITAKYEAGSTQDNKAFALIKTTSSGNADKDANDAGKFTVACKVTY